MAGVQVVSKAYVDALAIGQASGVVGYETLALLEADLAHDAGAIAYVTNDPDPANNGTYRKEGASGAGEWVQASFDRVTLVENSVSILGRTERAARASVASIREIFADVAGVTAQPLVPGLGNVSVSAAVGGGVTVVTSANSGASHVVDAGYVIGSGYVTAKVSARVDVLTGNPATGIALGDGPERRLILYRSDGSVFILDSNGDSLESLKVADAEWAYGVNDDVSLRVEFDTSRAGATVAIIRPDGEALRLAASTSLPEGSVGIAQRANSTYTVTELQVAVAPPAVVRMYGMNQHPSRYWHGGTILSGAWSAEDGVLSVTMEADSGTARYAFDFPAVGDFAPGELVSAQVEARQEHSSRARLLLIFLDQAGAEISRITESHATIGAFQPLTALGVVVPALTATVRVAYDGVAATLAASTSQFRNPVVVAGETLPPVVLNAPSPAANQGGSGGQVVYVAPGGSDLNPGTSAAPFRTIGAALDAVGPNGAIEIAAGDYRETVDLAGVTGHVELRAALNSHVRILGSTQLVVTKTAGRTQVYEAPLGAKPTGMGGNRGAPMIFEEGVPSKPVPSAERHPLHRGQTHRLPYTELLETQATNLADALDELDSELGRGRWYWESGTIYFTASDGGDATERNYEARTRSTLLCSGSPGGSVSLKQIEAWYSASSGMNFAGLRSVYRENCRVFGSYSDGFADDVPCVTAFRDEAAGCGNDGANAHMASGWEGLHERAAVRVGKYTDPWYHDNYDDGISYHERGERTLIGGLYEYNTKAGVVDVSGAAVTCHAGRARKNGSGFYIATPDPSGGRDGSLMECHGCVSEDNNYNFRAAGDGMRLEAFGCVSRRPTTAGYHTDATTAEIIASNCRHTGPGTARAGNVTVVDDAALT